MNKIDNAFNTFKQNVNTIMMSEINKCNSNSSEHNNEYIDDIANNIVVDVNAGFKINSKTLEAIPQTYTEYPLHLETNSMSDKSLFEPPTEDLKKLFDENNDYNMCSTIGCSNTGISRGIFCSSSLSR